MEINFGFEVMSIAGKDVVPDDSKKEEEKKNPEEMQTDVPITNGESPEEPKSELSGSEFSAMQ
jgi:hypothetical protein